MVYVPSLPVYSKVFFIFFVLLNQMPLCRRISHISEIVNLLYCMSSSRLLLGNTKKKNKKLNQMYLCAINRRRIEFMRLDQTQK